MDQVRLISSTVLSLRKKAGLRVRLPLANLTVVTTDTQALAGFEGILRDELNVKAVTLVEQQPDSAESYGITPKLTVNARAAGPRLGKQVQQVIKAARTGDWSESGGVVTAGGIELVAGEYAESVLNTSALALLAGGGFVLLETSTTPELEAEGLARDLIRAVQDTRKSAGFEVSDRIRLDVVFLGDADAATFALATAVDVAGETLATRFATHVSSSVDAGALAAGTPAEWLPGLTGTPVEHYVSFKANHYANSAPVIVAVARDKGTINV
jgi:isoleucyl-tRNA synthetase